jgi:biopolymer transport protein ExbD
VAVTPEGNYFVDGEQVSRPNLPTAIRSAYQNKPGATLVVRADKDARVDDAVIAMNIGKALNMSIVMATERN